MGRVVAGRGAVGHEGLRLRHGGLRGAALRLVALAENDFALWHAALRSVMMAGCVMCGASLLPASSVFLIGEGESKSTSRPPRKNGWTTAGKQVDKLGTELQYFRNIHRLVLK